MTYATYRPKGTQGQGDSHLPRIVQNLRRKLARVQRDFTYDSLRLDDDGLGELAGMLVDFAEDLHNDIGLWAAYERYNVDSFGTPLPLNSRTSGDTAATGIHSDRFRHLLWISYPAFIDGLALSPTHKDLQRVADASGAFLRDECESVPRDSGVQSFLQAPNEYGWDVKRKLIWLGTSSYMFRVFFANYMGAQDKDGGDIGHTDDFICQECTRWSGLGAIDILAGVLDISDHDRKDLRSWYERHAAFYTLLSVGNETLEALNVISDQPYRIRINMAQHPFESGQLVFGSLVPWRGEWYWSGEQKLWGDASDVDVDDIKQTMKRQNSQIVCRYWKDYEALVRQRASDLHDAIMTYYGNDLIEYPDGLSMASDWQKEFRCQWESKDQQKVQEAIEKHGLKDGRPEMPMPKDLLEHKNGVGVFINPDEGKEIMQDFRSVIAGLKRKGAALTRGRGVLPPGLLRGGCNQPEVRQTGSGPVWE
ncbi:MAG: DUF3843 family protein [Planctomycetota bacterium]|jgi:hypothetical protein